MILNENPEHVAVRRFRRQLEQKALCPIPGPDSQRLQALNHLERFFPSIHRDRAGRDRAGLAVLGRLALETLGNFLQRGRQIAALVQMGDQVFEQGKLLGGRVQEGQLMAQIFLERLGSRRHVLHGVVLLVGFLIEAVARRLVAFIEVVPVPAQSFQAIKIDFLIVALVNDQLAFEFGRALVLKLSVGFFVWSGFVIGDFFLLEHRILLQLLLDALLERHDGQLKDLHRLNHAGGQNHPLVHPLT